MARRFQSGLGSEFTRRYKEGQQVDTLMLMSVTKVHYKYNTVDLIALKHKETFTTSYANEGKYSAKLPMEFGGRNIAGQPYGQINPVTVGTIVLVGFVQSDKNNPIILSVYGNNAVTEKLARAPFVSAEPNDESLAKQMYQKFTLYPSLTYDSVDGDGTRVVSFSGKSFIVFDTAPNTNATMISDGNYGTTYEDLGTSFYNDGEVIEPMSGLAPNVLFKHQGVLDSNDEPDNHQFMIHIASDGTYRTSQMNKKEDWRTLFEMTPEGEVRLRRQGDTIRLNDGFQIGELEIDKYGVVRLRNGEMDLEVRSDGLYSQGKPLGESIGGDVDLSEIYDKLNGIDKDIAWANTEITNIGGEVKVVAEKTTIIDGQVKEMESSVSILAEKIETKVSAVEVEEMIDDSLTEVNADIQKAKDEAEKANNMISDMANDNRLTPSEKTDLSAEWEIIKSEYPSYINQANIYEVNSDAYEEAYNKLEDFVEGVLVDMNATMVIDGTQMRNLFKTYYNERIALLNSILKGLKDGITEAMKAASEAQLDATDALANSAQAQIDANRANSLIDDIASDGKLTPSEKTQLKKEWDIIVKEYPKTIQQAVKYKVNTDDLTLKYNTLKNIVEPLLQDLTQTSIVNGQEVRDRMSDYYASKTQVLKDISDLAQDVMTDYGNRINVAETAITQTAEAITLMATKVETIDGDVKANKAQLEVQAEQISQKVTASEVKGVVDDAIKDIQVGGTNLFVIYTQTNGWLNETDGTVGAVQDNSVVSNYIKVRATSPYVASLFNNTGTNTIVICWYDTNRTFISGQAVANTGDFSQQYKSPEGAVYARLSYKRANVTLMKFESGTKATDFSYAWEDIKNDQTLLEQYIKDVEAQAEKAQESADDAKNNADHANQQIDDIANDNILTPSEKQQILLQWEEIKTEYPLNIDQASKFGANATQYTNMYTALDTYLTPILADLTTNSVIIGSTLRTTFKNYYDRRTTLLNNIAEISKTLANNAQNKADQLDDDMNNIGGYNYVGFSSGDNVYPRLMIKNVGYYSTVNANLSFVDDMVSMKSKVSGSLWYYNIGTSSSSLFSNLADFRMKEVKQGQWLTASANLQVIGVGSASLKIFLYNGRWEEASSQEVIASNGVLRVAVQQKVKATTTGVLVRVQSSSLGDVEVRFGNVQLEVGARATPWKKSDIDIMEDINNVVNDIKLYPAWTNDLTNYKEFTRVYPKANMLANSKLTSLTQWRSWDGATGSTRELKEIPDSPATYTKKGFYLKKQSAGNWGYAQDGVKVEPNTKYTLTVWAKSVIATGSTISLQSGNGTTDPWATTNTAVTTVWTRVSHTFTTKASSVSLNIYVGMTGETTGEAYITAPKLEKGEATVFVPNANESVLETKMKYSGTFVKDSDIPADYVWSLSTEYSDADKQEQINGKEGTWIYQPIPPSNPSIGLVWVDTTKVPYQPKRYTGTENGWVPLTPEDVSDLPWGDDGSSLADWINQAEQKISATSIVNTVLSSGDFTDLYNTKANTSDLDTLASQSELKAMREEYNRLLKEGIDGIDFTPYVTQSELEQLKDSFNFSIQQAGGVNLLKNSLGFADLSFWTGGQGVTTTQSDSLAALGFGSGFHFLNQRSTLLKQKVTLPKVGDGVKYSLSLYMQVSGEFDATAKLGARIYEGDTLVTTLGINSEVGQQAYPVGYQQYATVWTPNQEEVTVELFVQNGDSLDIIISGVMLNIGDLALKWQPYPSEIYNTSVRIDLRGITVKNTSTDGYTAITPQEFSGYARVDGQIERIFTLNGQTTEVTALKVDRSITMAPISIFTMNSSTSKGWAFV